MLDLSYMIPEESEESMTKETNNNGYYNYNTWTIEKKVVDNA